MSLIEIISTGSVAPVCSKRHYSNRMLGGEQMRIYPDCSVIKKTIEVGGLSKAELIQKAATVFDFIEPIWREVII